MNKAMLSLPTASSLLLLTPLTTFAPLSNFKQALQRTDSQQPKATILEVAKPLLKLVDVPDGMKVCKSAVRPNQNLLIIPFVLQDAKFITNRFVPGKFF